MKKIYMPSNDVLLKMQDLGGDIYKYLLAKTIESLIIDGINYPVKGILKNAYKYFRENPEIVIPICLMYPEEIMFSEIASYDANLAMKLLDKTNDNTIYNLDNLVYFKEIISSNIPVIKKTIDVLDEYLPSNPKYRFEYKENPTYNYENKKVEGNNIILDDIFSTKILDRNIFLNSDLMQKLAKIEPAYAILIDTVTYQDDFLELNHRKEALNKGIYAYTKRYNIRDCFDAKNIDLDNPDNDVKRLIRCIKNNKNLY